MKLLRCNNGYEHPVNLFGDWMERLFDDEFLKLGRESRPSVNLREEKDAVKLDMALPGWKKEDIRVSIEGKELVVQSEKKKEKETRESGYLRQEFSAEAFNRRFRLDDFVEISKIEAQFQNGVLEVTLPRKEKGKNLAREIKIN